MISTRVCSEKNTTILFKFLDKDSRKDAAYMTIMKTKIKTFFE